MAKLKLRSFADSEIDFELMQEIFSDPLFIKHMQTREQEVCIDANELQMRLMVFARKSKGGVDELKVLYESDSKETFGISGLLSKNSGLGSPELSIYIRKKFRNLGFAKEGIKLTIQESSISDYSAFVDFDNLASQKLMISAGLVLSGIIFHRNLKREGLLYLSPGSQSKIK